MITFVENQEKIYVGKHKITKCNFSHPYNKDKQSNHIGLIRGWLLLHIVHPPNNKSGYNMSKYVEKFLFPNIYDMETIKNEITIYLQNTENILNLRAYIWGGGYEYDKKTF